MLTKFARSGQVQPNQQAGWKGLNTSIGIYSNDVETVIDCCDVDFELDGSICTRSELTPFSVAGITGGMNGVVFWEDANGLPFIIWQNDAGQMKFIANGPGNVGDFPITLPTGPCPITSFQAHGAIFISNGNKVIKWDGTAFDVTTTSYHDSIANPLLADNIDNLGVPAFCEAVTWQNAAWLVSPVLSTTIANHDDEVWYSAFLGTYNNVLSGEKDYANSRALGFPSGLNKDGVMALCACGDRMYVFKNRSIGYVQGSDFDLSAFKAGTLSSDLGLANRKAHTCINGNTVFYDPCEGLHAIDQSGTISYLMTSIDHVLQENLNPKITAVGSCDSKIYMSIATRSVTKNDTTYVYSTKNKTWTKYCFGIDCFIGYRPTQGDCLCLAVVSDPCESIVVLNGDKRETLVDDLGSCKRPYNPEVQFNFTDFGSGQIEKIPVCTTFSFESLEADVRVATAYDWDFAVKNTALRSLTGVNVKCFSDGTEICFAPACIEVINPEFSRPIGDCVDVPTDLVSGVSAVDIPGKCKFISRAFALRGVSGHWCLRRISSLYKIGRIKL